MATYQDDLPRNVFQAGWTTALNEDGGWCLWSCVSGHGEMPGPMADCAEMWNRDEVTERLELFWRRLLGDCIWNPPYVCSRKYQRSLCRIGIRLQGSEDSCVELPLLHQGKIH